MAWYRRMMEADAEAFVAAQGGNWLKWTATAWWERPEDGEQWIYFEPAHRDSDTVDRSNFQEIKKLLEPFTHGQGTGPAFVRDEDADIEADVDFSSMSCSLVGHRELVRVRAWVPVWDFEPDMITPRVRKAPTAAGRVLYDIVQRLDRYPVLNEDVHSEMEWEEWHEYFASEVESVFRRKFKDTEDTTEVILGKCLDWLGENDVGVDSSVYPDEAYVIRALEGAGYELDEE